MGLYPACAKLSVQQLHCNCRSGRGEDCAFEDDGEAVNWFEPLAAANRSAATRMIMLQRLDDVLLARPAKAP